MTREQLEAYRSMQEEIKELKYKLQHLGEEDGDKLGKLREWYTGRIAQLQKECDAVEAYIEGIEDSMTRRIFRMYFLESMKQKEIAKRVHMDRSMVSRKINAPTLCFQKK